MRLITREIPRDTRIVIAGCLHSGAANCYWEGIQKLIERVKEPDVFCMLNTGDNVEAKIPSDKHYGRSSFDEGKKLFTPQDQAEELCKTLRPIADKIGAIGRGNHEYKLANTWDIGKQISDNLGVPYGWYLYKFRALDDKGKVQFKGLIHHGKGMLTSNAKDPIQRKANKMASLKQKFIQTMISDVIFFAGSHWHQQLIVSPTYLSEKHIVDKGGKITQRYRKPMGQSEDWIPPDAKWYASIGCMRMTYTQPDAKWDDYAEIGMYGAADLGWTEVVVHDWQVVDMIPVEV